MNLTILCDIDGVVANLCPEWFRLYNQDSGDNLTIDLAVTWDVHKYVMKGWEKKIYEYLWRDDLYDNVKPYPLAISSIAELRGLGNRVIFVTAGLQPAKIRWLMRMGLIDQEIWRSDPDWIIATDKSVFKGDIMIDDYPKNLEKFEGEGYLMDAPYNQEEKRYKRLSSLADAVYFIGHR
jgi:5'(3')-deoxyribonucleotidase